MASTISDETGDRAIAHATTRKILIAMYGRETVGWAARGLGRPRDPAPCEYSWWTTTSPRRSRPSCPRHAGASAPPSPRGDWRSRAAGKRCWRCSCPTSPNRRRLSACRSAGDAGRTIAATANAWPADVVLVGHDCRGPVERALAGRVHERVVRFARSPVLVIAAEPLARAARRIGRLPVPWRTPARGGV